MNTISITSIGAIVLGLLAAIAVAFPVSAEELGVSLDANATVSSDAARASTSAGAEVKTYDETTKEETRSGPFTIIRASLGGAAETETAPKSAAAVRSDSDLSAYTTAALRADENIDAVTYNAEDVEVSHYEKGRILGIFPVTMTVTTTVASDGAVTVSYPWYRFLVASDTNANVQSDIQARVDAWKANASAEAGFTASEKAALMDEIRAAIQSSASVTASVK